MTNTGIRDWPEAVDGTTIFERRGPDRRVTAARAPWTLLTPSGALALRGAFCKISEIGVFSG